MTRQYKIVENGSTPSKGSPTNQTFIRGGKILLAKHVQPFEMT